MLRSELHHDYKMAALGAGKRISHALTGSRQAVGDITFTGQPTANDTFTLNGTAFTAKASGAAGNQFNISGVNLSGTIDAMVTVLNASIDAAVAKATYSNVGGTKLHVVFDVAGTAGNAFTLAEASSAASPSGATLTGGSGVEVIKLDAETYGLVTLAGSTPMNFTLPAGEEAQEITLYLKTKGAGANAVVAGTFAGSATTATFDTAGDFVKLKFLGGIWQALANSSVTIA